MPNYFGPHMDQTNLIDDCGIYDLQSANANRTPYINMISEENTSIKMITCSATIHFPRHASLSLISIYGNFTGDIESCPLNLPPEPALEQQLFQLH